MGTIGFDPRSRCLDYGGSAGPLTRLMRDSGYDCFAYDLYDHSKYANYFRLESLADCKPSLISAFEVIEHLPEPRATLTELVSTKPELLIFTTPFYEGQGHDWPYLVPICGQHVFFYTRRALESFAHSCGYELRKVLDLWVFVRRKGAYLSAIEQGAGIILEAGFAGEQVMRVGWGTDSTLRDSDYAFDRFSRELWL